MYETEDRHEKKSFLRSIVASPCIPVFERIFGGGSIGSGGYGGGKYERQGDYLIPCIALPAEEEQPIGNFQQINLYLYIDMERTP